MQTRGAVSGKETGMADEYRYGPENKGPQGGPESGGPGYHFQYNYDHGTDRKSAANRSKPAKKGGGAGDWIGIAVLFTLPTFGITQLIAFIWLIRKLASMTTGGKRRYKQEAQRAADDARDARAAALFNADGQPGPEKAQPDGWNVRDPAENLWQKARKQAKSDSAKGKSLAIGGGIISGIFGLGTMAVTMPFIDSMFSGLDAWPLLIPIAACAMFLAGGIAMLASGIEMGRRGERYLNYLAYIGANQEVSLEHMAAAFDVSVGKLCKDLRKMLAKGILPAGYLDMADGMLYLTGMGYRAPEPEHEILSEETAQEAAAREDDILQEIRQVNESIPDAEMSAKIDRIEEITGKILKYQKEHPNKEGQLRSFLNYYLPTTLKILRAYAQLDAQGVEGENISAAKRRIEDMMDQVVYGFERQLDKLFQDDAMDIKSDVEVLENMLKKDGLSDEGGITMTL